MSIAIIACLWICGLGYLGFGIACLLAPGATLAMAGIVVPDAAVGAEYRAFYGGLELALGGLMLACALIPARRRDGLVLGTATFGLLGLSRVFAMVLDGVDTTYLRLALATELGLALACGLLLVWSRRTRLGG